MRNYEVLTRSSVLVLVFSHTILIYPIYLYIIFLHILWLATYDHLGSISIYASQNMIQNLYMCAYLLPSLHEKHTKAKDKKNETDGISDFFFFFLMHQRQSSPFLPFLIIHLLSICPLVLLPSKSICCKIRVTHTYIQFQKGKNYFITCLPSANQGTIPFKASLRYNKFIYNFRFAS